MSEHRKVWVEQVLDKKLKELFPESSFVNSWLANEHNFELLLEVDAWVHNLVQSILQDVISPHI